MIVSSPQFSFVQLTDCPACEGTILEVKQASDIAFQVLVSEAKGRSLDYVIATDSEVELYRERINPLGSVGGQYLYFICSSANLYDLLTEERCFKFGIAEADQPPVVFSNLFRYSPSVSFSVLLEYRCDEELALGFCFPKGVFNRVRLPLRIYKPQTKEERNVYAMRNGKQKVLSASLAKEFEMETDWISEDFHDKLSIALLHDTTIFDGKLFTKSSNYEISWDDDVLDSAPAKCKLIENIIYRNINCGGISMADTVDMAALILAVKNLVPVGTIVDYFGDVTKLPENWELCDGGYSEVLGKNRPDLRGRFSLGYGKFVEDGTTYSYEIGDTGGRATVTLTQEQLPIHKHISGIYMDADVADSVYGLAEVKPGSRKEGGTWANLSPYTSEAGQDQPHENRPPYYVSAKIIRVAQPNF